LDDSLFKEIATLYLASSSSAGAPVELLFAFLAHSIILETVSVEERARQITTVHSELSEVMLKKFLPAIFLAVEDVVSCRNAFCNIDGRIYLSLIQFLMDNHGSPMHGLIGVSVCDRMQSLWSSLGLAPVDFGALAIRFPHSPPPEPPLPDIVTPEPLRLLPFDNGIFNKDLSALQVTGEDEDEEVLDSVNFGQRVLFSDSHHWHNNKAILPRHLGGEDSKPKNEWHRRKILKSEQRFMATLQRQAGTLTGALGASLDQIVIPPVGSRAAKPKAKGHLISATVGRENVGT
jgi:hypothetical protein